MILAYRVVEIYHGEDMATQAQFDFIETFKKGGVPQNIQTIHVAKETLLGDVLVESNILSSKSEWRRLVDEGAIAKLPEGRKITDPYSKVESGDFKIGKKRFIKIEIV